MPERQDRGVLHVSIACDTTLIIRNLANRRPLGSVRAPLRELKCVMDTIALDVHAHLVPIVPERLSALGGVSWNAASEILSLDDHPLGTKALFHPEQLLRWMDENKVERALDIHPAAELSAGSRHRAAARLVPLCQRWADRDCAGSLIAACGIAALAGRTPRPRGRDRSRRPGTLRDVGGRRSGRTAVRCRIRAALAGSG